MLCGGMHRSWGRAPVDHKIAVYISTPRPGLPKTHARLTQFWCALQALGSGSQRAMDNQMALSREDVEHVAALARLGLTDDEITRMQDQLSSILGHIAALESLDTAVIPPTAQVISLSNVMRDDVVTPSLPRDAVLANAPRQSHGFFEVHAVLGGEAEETP